MALNGMKEKYTVLEWFNISMREEQKWKRKEKKKKKKNKRNVIFLDSTK